MERSIHALVEQGFLDDVRFAHLFVEDKRELKGWGADRIRQVLRSRGVEAEVVEEALADHEQDSEGEVERALAVLRRRFPSPPRERRERDRALGVLLRKGDHEELALEAIAAHARDTDTFAQAASIAYSRRAGRLRDGRYLDPAPVRPGGARSPHASRPEPPRDRGHASLRPPSAWYYDPVKANEGPTGHKEHQQISYILDSGLSVDGKHHRAARSIQTRPRTRQVAAY